MQLSKIIVDIVDQSMIDIFNIAFDQTLFTDLTYITITLIIGYLLPKIPVHGHSQFDASCSCKSLCTASKSNSSGWIIPSPKLECESKSNQNMRLEKNIYMLWMYELLRMIHLPRVCEVTAVSTPQWMTRTSAQGKPWGWLGSASYSWHPYEILGCHG